MGWHNISTFHSKVEKAPDDTVKWLGLFPINFRSLQCRDLHVDQSSP